ncbi:hypothetical protein SAMN02745589_0565, partial [Bifidobacterium merycicum DSM 6492]
NLEQRKKFLDDVQWVEAMKKLRGAEETHTDDKAPHWSWTWTPWYVATQDGTSVYIRGRHYQDGKGAHLVWTDTIRVTKSNKGHLLGHVLPGDNAPLYPNSFNPYYRNNNLDAGFTEVSQMIYGTDVNDYSSSSDITNIFPFGYWPGDPDTVMSHFRYFAGDYGYHGYGVDDAYKDGVAFSECGDDCPAAYQPTVKDQDVSVDVTSQSGDGTRTTVSGGGQSTGSSTGWAPGHIQTKLNDDGSVSGSVSIDANTKTGTVNLGSGGLDGIYPNAAGKRLDLIDVKTGKSCFLEGYACVDWVKEVQEIIPDHQLDVTTKVTTKEQPALSYKCSYDVPGKITEVPIGECIAYAPSFGEEAQRSGQTTGQPDGSTATDTTTAPAKDYDWSDCVKSGTQGNAAAWLYEPIVCAANILIVPRTKVLTTTRAKFARDTSNGILPQWRALQVNWAGLFDIDLGSCHGYRFSFGWNGIKIFDDAEVLNACPGQQLDFLPKISCAVITLLLCIVAVMICRKAFMAIFDYHPGGDGGEA